MANPYSPYDPNEDESLAFGGQLPAQVNALSDALRSAAGGGLPLSPQQGTGLPTIPTSSPSSPQPAPSQLPSDFGAALEDYASGQGGGQFSGLPIVPSVAPSPMAVQPQGMPFDPSSRYPMTGATLTQFNDLQDQLAREKGMTDNSLLYRLLGVFNPGGWQGRQNALEGSLSTMQRQAEADQQAREAHDIEKVGKLVEIGNNFNKMVTDPMLSEAQRNQLVALYGPQVFKAINGLAAGTPYQGITTYDDFVKTMKDPGAFKQMADDLAKSDPARRDQYIIIAKQNGLKAANDWLRQEHEQDYKDFGSHAMTLAEAAIAEMKKTNPNQNRFEISAVRDAGNKMIDSVQGDAVTLPDGTQMPKAQAKSIFARALVDTKFEKERSDLSIGPPKPVDVGHEAVGLSSYISDTPEWKAWSAAHGNVGVNTQSLSDFNLQDGQAYGASLAKARKAKDEYDQQKRLDLVSAEGDQKRKAEADFRASQPAYQVPVVANKYGQDKTQIWDPVAKKNVTAEALMLPADELQRRLSLPPGSKGSLVDVGKEESSTLRGVQATRSRYTKYLQLLQSVPDGPGFINNLLEKGKQLMGEQNIITGIDALRTNIISEGRALTGGVPRSNAVLSIVEKSNISPNMSKAQMIQVLTQAGKLMDLSESNALRLQEPADVEAQFKQMLKEAEVPTAPAQGGNIIPRRSPRAIYK